MEESGRPAATYPFPHPPSSPASRPASPPSQQTTTKDYQRLWKDVTSKNDEGEAVRILTNILQDAEGTTFISDLALDDAELCIEMLDHGLARHNLNSTEKQAFIVALTKLATIHGRLPESTMMREEIKVSDEMVACGGFADVGTGTYKGRVVAVKTLRARNTDEFPKIRERFCRTVALWNALSHPNVLKLVGVQGDMDKGQFTIVSEWMAHGNIMEYISKNQVNRLELLHGAAQGLKYLHGANLVHGDIRGANIHMSNDSPPRACLADFGFMTMALDPDQLGFGNDMTMFMSPELLVPEKFGFLESVPTPEADIYGLGLVIYQVLTGEPPFTDRRIAEMVLNVIQGVRPPKPENASAIGFSDSLWSLVERCWDGEMKLRPKIAEVVSQLERAATDWDRVIPPLSSASPKPASDSTAHFDISFDMDDRPSPQEAPRSPSGLFPPPALPPAPANCFFGEDFMNEILDFTDQVVSTALYGTPGVGKSVVALTILHHSRTKATFGRNRHFMDCNDLIDSPANFLERLSEATGIDRTTDIEQLRSHLESLPPCLLVLDGVDPILDPLAPEAEKISAIIEEFGSNHRVCLVTTSRMKHDIHGFYPIAVSMLPKESTQETFYKLCNLDRSPEVDDLIARLDFHPLFIDLLARLVRENDWGVKAVFDAWDDDQGVLRANYRQSLKEALELSLRSPTIQKLGTAVQDVLSAIAAFPNAVEERRLGNIFPYITEVEAVVDVLCRFSLIYREDGFVRMHSPFQFYFLDSMLELAQEEETIRWGRDCRPAKGVPPIYKHLLEELPGITVPSIFPPSVNRVRNRLFKKRKDDKPSRGFWGRLKRKQKGSAAGSQHHTDDGIVAIDTTIPTEESPASSTYSDSGDENMLSNVSPSTEVTNFWTVCDTVDIPGNVDDPVNMDDQPGPQDNPVNMQNDEGQFGGSENVVETEQEFHWERPLFVFFVLLSFGIAIA